MTRTHVLAELLYTKTIEMKNLPIPSLRFAANRKRIAENFCFFQFITFCLGFEEVYDAQTEKILSKLKSDFGYFDAAFAEKLKSTNGKRDTLPNYQDLLFEMMSLLSACITEILQKRPQKDKLKRMILAFHNYPRAFLSLTDRRKISPTEAMDYARAYLK